MAEPTLCEARLAKIIASFEGKHAELLEEETQAKSLGRHRKETEDRRADA
jgi:hypothetical protein